MNYLPVAYEAARSNGSTLSNAMVTHKGVKS